MHQALRTRSLFCGVGFLAALGLADPASARVIDAFSAPAADPQTRASSFTLSSKKTETYRYAFVLGRVVARRAPSRQAAPVARLERRTAERTDNIVLALEGRRTGPEGIWIRVRLPVLPNNTTGWVHRRALSAWTVVRTRLVVSRRALRATLFRRGRAIFSARVGVGASQWPTPAGDFYVRSMLYGYDAPEYGPIAFGTNARSPTLTDWPYGGIIGIHGTNQPQSVPGRGTHGCIRLRNADIIRLARVMPVGTPLTVR